MKNFDMTKWSQQRVLQIVTASFVLIALCLNLWAERWVTVLIHSGVLVAFGVLLLPRWKNETKRLHLYLALMLLYWIGFFWLGDHTGYDIVWIILFPVLVVYVVDTEREFLLWQIAVIIVLILVLVSPAGAALPNRNVISGNMLLAITFIGFMSWLNLRYKIRYIETQRTYAADLKKDVRRATATIRYLNRELEINQRDVVIRLGEICEKRSQETGQHVVRVSEYSRRLAELAGLPEEEVQRIYDATPLHDIGKVGIPDSLLKTPERYTPEQHRLMQSHAMIGYELLNSSRQNLLKVGALIARDHHEWWDGSGYPRGVQGEEISTYGRIVALADVFDALSFPRVYKPAWSDDKIYAYFQERKGTQFDPHLCELFLTNLENFKTLRENLR